MLGKTWKWDPTMTAKPKNTVSAFYNQASVLEDDMRVSASNERLAEKMLETKMELP